MFCQHCGHELWAECKFCGECGREVAGEVVRVAVEKPREKPVTFEEFMASRGGETSRVSGATLDAQFQAAKKAKKKERSSHFKSKGNKKTDETVKIFVGLVVLNNDHTELKIKRASLLPVPLRKSATDVTVKRLAIEKHLAHNKMLRMESAENNTEWILLYPDLDVVLYIPGTKECFSVEKYKESIGKPYNRVNLYLCRKTDYEAALTDTDTDQGDTEKEESEKTLDSSGEVTLNIPVFSRQPVPSKPPSVASSQSDTGTLFDGQVARTSASRVEVINLDDDLEDDLDLQQAIFQSSNSAAAVLVEERESLETVLTRFQSEKVGNEDDFQIIRIRRNKLWEDTVRAVTKSGFRCNAHLKVHFIAEEAEDEGGPLREFLRLAINAICETSGALHGSDHGKTFSNNPMLIERGAYYCSGIITGMSLQQGGPALNCLSSSVFDYFVGGLSSSKPTLQDVADHDTKIKIEKISLATDDVQFQQAVREETDFLIECGISKMNWKFNEKNDLELILCKNNVIYRPKAALDQFLEGLQTVGLLRYVRQYPVSFKGLFCHAPCHLTVSSFRKLLTIDFTEPGSNENNRAREGEEITILWWEEFLDKLERCDTECLLPQLLVFISGADNIPVLGFPKPIDIEFFDIDPRLRLFPMASTCGLRLKLPRGIPTYEEFENLITRFRRFFLFKGIHLISCQCCIVKRPHSDRAVNVYSRDKNSEPKTNISYYISTCYCLIALVRIISGNFRDICILFCKQQYTQY